MRRHLPDQLKQYDRDRSSYSGNGFSNAGSHWRVMRASSWHLSFPPDFSYRQDPARAEDADGFRLVLGVR